MKLKSLILGSVAAAGLTTGAQAADLSVLTSLDVCDLLGISGLTISSDTNCLAITGEVKYEFTWGDYGGTALTVVGGHDNVTFADNDGTGTDTYDWDSKVDAYLQFVGTAESDFGPASATIKFDYDNDTDVNNEDALPADTFGGNGTLRIEDAYVSIGDSTVIMAGQKGSIFKNGDDVELTVWKLFNSEGVDRGVDTPVTDFLDGGPSHSIQVVADLGNGVSVGAGLENLNGQLGTSAVSAGWATADGASGVFTGFVEYKGDGITAHAAVVGGGILDGTVEEWGIHSGFTGTFDNFKLVGAFAADSNSYWNALLSGSATFDMFTLAAAFEYVDRSTAAADQGWGFSGSAAAAVTDMVTINLGFRYFDETTAANDETWQAAAQLVASLTETLKATGEIGLVSSTKAGADITYGSVELAWAPGGGFTSSVKGEINSEGAYKTTFKAAKAFK